MQNPFSLGGKVILITGGYGYLGRAITAGLLENGAQVVVLGRSIEKFNAAFPAVPSELFFQVADVSSTESVKEAFAQVYDKFGQLDGLINNAYYSQGQNPLALTDAEFALGLDGNLGATYRCIREVVPYMQNQQAGRIINVSSMYGMVSPDFSVYQDHPKSLNPPHYGAAKAGVLQLTRYFACYLGQDNILVNAVTPGPFPSEAVQENIGFIRNLEKKSPLGRIGKPEDLKGVFVLLCSELSNYITGQNFVVDGGWTAW